jgi:osmotically-inducible protein OsmY|uniref:BON domain-containing protein n=1 Tax=Schlesneria paludicola TaxID=360056 RepID=A0A7C4LJM1_9PLAN
MPLPETLEDTRTLEERVEQVVLSRTSGRIRCLRVQVQDGRVILSGRTSSYYNKQLATHAALEAAASVQNEVEVC